jgi:hypothetical protein
VLSNRVSRNKILISKNRRLAGGHHRKIGLHQARLAAPMQRKARRWPGLSEGVSRLFLLRGFVLAGLVVLLLILLTRLAILRVGLAGLSGLIGCSNIDTGHRIIFRFNSEIFRANS